MYEYKALITKVVDGNTVYAEIDLGFQRTHYAALTLSKIKAAMPSPQPDILDAGDLARIYLENLVLKKTIRIKVYKDGSADLFQNNGDSVNGLMVLMGHAVVCGY